MRKLIIDPSPSTPSVVLDPEKKIYLISGESRPADVRVIYDQIISWLDEFRRHLDDLNDMAEPVMFNFKLDYFNSSSAKLILDICKILGDLKLRGFNVTIKWHYEEEDLDLLEAGKEMSKIVRFPFEYIETSLN